MINLKSWFTFFAIFLGLIAGVSSSYASIELSFLYNQLSQTIDSEESKKLVAKVNEKALEELNLSEVNQLYMLVNKNAKQLRNQTTKKEFRNLKDAFSLIRKQRNVLIQKYLSSTQYRLFENPKSVALEIFDQTALSTKSLTRLQIGALTFIAGAIFFRFSVL